MTYSEFSVYIGIGFNKKGKPIEGGEGKEQKVKEWAAELFGAYSVLQLQGGWIKPGGGWVEEPAIKIEINTNSANSHLVKEFAKECRELFEQEKVLVTERKLDQLEFL